MRRFLSFAGSTRPVLRLAFWTSRVLRSGSSRSGSSAPMLTLRATRATEALADSSRQLWRLLSKVKRTRQALCASKGCFPHHDNALACSSARLRQRCSRRRLAIIKIETPRGMSLGWRHTCEFAGKLVGQVPIAHPGVSTSPFEAVEPTLQQASFALKNALSGTSE